MNVKTLLLTAVLTLIACTTSANDDLPGGVQATIDTYFNGIQQGDLTALASVLDGQMKKRHDRASRNPNYAASLSASHATTTFAVLSSKVDDAMVTVDYQASTNGQTIRRQIYLRPSASGYKIIGETLLP